MLFQRKKKLKPLDAYNLWARSYSNENNPIKNLSNNLIANWLNDAHDKTVLDAGCGAGELCKMALANGAQRITGVDFSEAMIKEAKKNLANFEFKCLDLAKEKIEGKFDIVICALVLGHIHNLDFALTNLISNLSPNGSLLITDFHPFQSMKGAKRTFTDQRSKKMFEVEHYVHPLEEYFEIVKKTNALVAEWHEPKWQNEPVVFGMKIRNH